MVAEQVAARAADLQAGAVRDVVQPQVDWSEVRERTKGNPSAAAALHLLPILGVVGEAPAARVG